MYQGYLESIGKIASGKRISAGSQSFAFFYRYYCNYLLNAILPTIEIDTKGMIPDRQCEKILLINGMIGCTTKYRGSKGKPAVFYGENCGDPTPYFDLWKSFAYTSPIDSRVLKVNKDIVMGWNNSTHTSAMPLIHNFAVLLAHVDLSIINALINTRVRAVAIAGTKAQLIALQNYRNDLANGKNTPIYDPALSFVDFKSFPSTSDISLTELLDFKKQSIEMFMNMNGVKTMHEKRGNMTVDEVSSNDSMLMLSIADREDSWRKFVDDVNTMLDYDWECRRNKYIDYDANPDPSGMIGKAVNEYE